MGDALPLLWSICGMPGALQSCEGGAALPATAHCAICSAKDSATAVDPWCCSCAPSDDLCMQVRHVEAERERTAAGPS